MAWRLGVFGRAQRWLEDCAACWAAAAHVGDLQYGVQLAPGTFHSGVLKPGAPFRRLVLEGCVLPAAPLQEDPSDEPETAGLDSALSHLTTLQHLSIRGICSKQHLSLRYVSVVFPAQTMLHLPHLTCLDLQVKQIDTAGLPHLSLLTAMQDLRLHVEGGDWTITTSMIAGMQQLTWLELGPCKPDTARSSGSRDWEQAFEPAALASMPHLKGLELGAFQMRDPSSVHAKGFAALLPQLAKLHQLEHLHLHHLHAHKSQSVAEHGLPLPVSAFSAITASSSVWSCGIVSYPKQTCGSTSSMLTASSHT